MTGLHFLSWLVWTAAFWLLASALTVVVRDRVARELTGQPWRKVKP